MIGDVDLRRHSSHRSISQRGSKAASTLSVSLKSFASRIRKSFLGSEESSTPVQSPDIDSRKSPRKSFSDRVRKHSGVTMLKRFFKRSLIGIEDSSSSDEDEEEIPFGTMTNKKYHNKKIIRHSHSVGNIESDIQHRKLRETVRIKPEMEMKKSDHGYSDCIDQEKDEVCSIHQHVATCNDSIIK